MAKFIQLDPDSPGGAKWVELSGIASSTMDLQWGLISGSISTQNDLLEILNDKPSKNHSHDQLHSNILDHEHLNINDLNNVIGTNTGDNNGHSGLESISNKGIANGYASLDINSKLIQGTTVSNNGNNYALLANNTTTLDLATNKTIKLTVTAAKTLTTTVPPAGIRCCVIILTSGTTAYTITFGTGFKPTGTLSTGTATNKVFTINWISDGTNLYENGRTAAMTA